MWEVCDKAAGYSVRMSSKPITRWKTLTNRLTLLAEKKQRASSVLVDKKAEAHVAFGFLVVWRHKLKKKKRLL